MTFLKKTLSLEGTLEAISGNSSLISKTVVLQPPGAFPDSTVRVTASHPSSEMQAGRGSFTPFVMCESCSHSVPPPPQTAGASSGHYQGDQAHAVLCSQEEIPGETMPSATDPKEQYACIHPQVPTICGDSPWIFIIPQESRLPHRLCTQPWPRHPLSLHLIVRSVSFHARCDNDSLAMSPGQEVTSVLSQLGAFCTSPYPYWVLLSEQRLLS